MYPLLGTEKNVYTYVVIVKILKVQYSYVISYVVIIFKRKLLLIH